MKEITGDIWSYHALGNWIVITTNGVVNTQGQNIMGKGIALQAKRKFPRLPSEIGWRIKASGNITCVFPEYRIITLPVKEHWRDDADLRLIEKGIQGLAAIGKEMGEQIYLVRPGCASGNLSWADVKLILERYLNDSFTVVERS